MRFAAYRDSAGTGLAISRDGAAFRGLRDTDPGFPGHLDTLLAMDGAAFGAACDALSAGAPVELDAVTLLPPVGRPGKIICVGLNYIDHSAESGFKQPDYPTLFGRFTSSLIGHGAPLLRPTVSEQFDYEGELVAIIGRGGRHIPRERALEHVFGYSIFNDGSVRDYQFKAPQWTMGKNFDDTGPFGPVVVTADELPPGAAGLRIETRLNGAVVQSSNTDALVFDVPTLVAIISEAITLEPGDLLVTGTPSGVGAARKPPLWMKPGDVCEVEIERIGVLRNPVADAA
ncbi:fumarylacetoacetate hydrolase family protein [Azospirillum sp. RWY-5-1]|uniref:Fumarylacetoacetate hydrolase family protein n=1 Tax=Azospirillum oleiclasticum TaxID=2735135 RepID=A0ABX2TLG8_9PROT|nr:fumarylacetoacetate hydrolase family protein [Azospirillum oleiclasticum]NYZ17489.1 fumarylacetoacetate hydrolase family protein [Azospirillum oleiclasticum]NYZ24867.1 fumarylacetoacetate hydrolase family protein [Azospirillum oleiclasticum]